MVAKEMEKSSPCKPTDVFKKPKPIERKFLDCSRPHHAHIASAGESYTVSRARIPDANMFALNAKLTKTIPDIQHSKNQGTTNSLTRSSSLFVGHHSKFHQKSGLKPELSETCKSMTVGEINSTKSYLSISNEKMLTPRKIMSQSPVLSRVSAERGEHKAENKEIKSFDSSHSAEIQFKPKTPAPLHHRMPNSFRSDIESAGNISGRPHQSSDSSVLYETGSKKNTIQAKLASNIQAHRSKSMGSIEPIRNSIQHEAIQNATPVPGITGAKLSCFIQVEASISAPALENQREMQNQKRTMATERDSSPKKICLSADDDKCLSYRVISPADTAFRQNVERRVELEFERF